MECSWFNRITCCLLALLLAGCQDRPLPSAPEGHSWGAIDSDPTALVADLSNLAVQGLGAPLDEFSIGRSVNDLGQVVFSSRDPDDIYAARAYLWEDGTLTELPSEGRAVAQDINVLGQIVGFAETASAAMAAVMWDGGVRIALGSLGGDRNIAKAINSLGHIVGESGDALGRRRPVMWVDGDPIELPTLGFDHGGAEDINDAGQIVGWLFEDGVSAAVVWDESGATVLPNLPGASLSVARGINDLGQIVGGSGPDVPNMAAVVWDNGIVQSLPAPGPGTTAFDINEWGQIAGVWQESTSPAAFRPLLWEGNEYYDLGTLHGSLGAAYALNNTGMVVGSSGEEWPGTHATLWTYSLVPVPPKEGLAELAELVEQLVAADALPANRAAALRSKLGVTARHVAAGRTDAARGALDGFTHLVEAWSETPPGAISTQTAERLLRLATEVREQL